MPIHSSFLGGSRNKCGSDFELHLRNASNYLDDADVFLTHFRDEIDPSKIIGKHNNNISISVLWGLENAAFSPVLRDAGALHQFDYTMNSNIQTAAIPLYSLILPPSNGHHNVPSFDDRPDFAMFVWSHCEPVRTEYARRMMEYANMTHGLKVASMGKCLKNDPITIPRIEQQKRCPDYRNVTSWDPVPAPRRRGCDPRTFPDMAARTYKFSLVFQNADCDYWVDLRLTTAWSSGSVVVFMGTRKELLQEFIPPALLNAMMFVKDYATPEALVDAMVSMDQTEFDRRVAWTKKGYDRSIWDKAYHGTEHPLCKVCRLRFDETLQDGFRPPKGAIPFDTCLKRTTEDWLS